MSKKPQSLEEFEARFGQLSERMNPAAQDVQAQENMPLAERPEEKEQPEQEPFDDGESRFEQNSSKDEFNTAASGKDPKKNGQGSKQVQNDAPEPTPRPPANSEGIDRATHQASMAEDQALYEAQFANLSEILDEMSDENNGQENDRDNGQDYDQ